ncbi:MAG TPA: hypothetical protein VF242_06890 [Nitrososphaeraceae archaeon]
MESSHSPLRREVSVVEKKAGYGYFVFEELPFYNNLEYLKISEQC